MAAATNATAGTSHDFDEMIGGCAGFNLLDQDAGIGEAIGNGDLECECADLNVGLLDAIETADLVELDLRQCFAGDHFAGGAEGRFHDPSGDAENDRRAGGFAEWIIEGFVFEADEVDAGLLQHAG